MPPERTNPDDNQDCSGDWARWREVVLQNQERHETAIEKIGDRIDTMKNAIICLLATVLIEAVFIFVQWKK
jgi:hypothetical protein